MTTQNRTVTTSTSSSTLARVVTGTACGAIALAAAWAGYGQLHGHSAAHVTGAAQPVSQTASAAPAAAVSQPRMVSSGPATDTSLVLVGSESQAQTARQGIEQTDAIRASLGLAPLNAAVVLMPGNQAEFTRQATDAADAIRAAMGVPPLAAGDNGYARLIADENTLRASLGLAPIALSDLEAGR